MPHRATRPGLCCVSFPHLSQVSFVVAKYLNCAHTKHTHIRAYTHALTPTPSVRLGMRSSALNFVFGTRLFPHIGQPLPRFLYPFSLIFTRHSLTGLEEDLFYFLSGNKNKLNGKTQVFFYYFFSFFSNSRHNVYQYSNLSVCLHSLVQCENIASHKLLDRCSYAAPCSLHLSCL